MMTWLYQLTFECSICHKQAKLLTHSLRDVREGWWEMRDAAEECRQWHFCPDCYESVFGLDGSIWQIIEQERNLRSVCQELETPSRMTIQNAADIFYLDDDDDDCIGLTD